MRNALGRFRTALFCFAISSLFSFIQEQSHAFTTIINMPSDVAPSTLGSDTQLNILEGGFLEVVSSRFHIGNSDGTSTNVEMNLVGGEVLTRGTGDEFFANAGSQVNIIDGDFGGHLRIRSGATLNVSGGWIGGPRSFFDTKEFVADDGSEVLISGGDFDAHLEARGGSNIQLVGGGVRSLKVREAANVVISGGTIEGLDLDRDAAITIQGGDFRWNGSLLARWADIGSSSEVGQPLTSGGTLSGILADGTPFVFYEPREGNVFLNSSITLETVALPPVGPPSITASSGPIPFGIRSGQSLLIDAPVGRMQYAIGPGSFVDVAPGGSIAKLEAFGATIDVSGGNAGGFIAINSDVHISDGDISVAELFKNSYMQVSGGLIRGGLDLSDDSEALVTGGAIEGGLTAQSGSTARVEGGVIDDIRVEADSFAYISGGEVESLVGLAGAAVTLIGQEFFVDGSPIPGLSPGNLVEILDRNVTISGILADGSPFSFPLNAVSPLRHPGQGDVFSYDATLMVTLVPEPSSLLLASLAGLLFCSRRR